MSCQQAPRVTEDPYVFTETVPTAPTLFNTQKLPKAQQQQQQQQQARFVIASDNTTSCQPIFKLNGQASSLSSPTLLSNLPTTLFQQTPLNGNQTFRNVISISPIANNSSDNLNAAIIQQSQQSVSHGGSTRIITTTAPPIGLNVISNKVSSRGDGSPVSFPTNKCTVRPRQSSLSLSSLWKPPPVIVQHHQQSSPPSPASSPSPPTVVNTLSTLLPPSNFHHTTLAQHLQKVAPTSASYTIQSSLSSSLSSNSEPFKAFTALNANEIQNKSVKRSDVSSLSRLNCQATNDDGIKSNILRTNIDVSKQQHVQSNHSDLNEIPVNVIYRTPQPTGEITCAHFGGGSSSTTAASALGQNVKLLSPVSIGKVSFSEKISQSTRSNDGKNVHKSPTLHETTITKVATKQSPKTTSILNDNRLQYQQNFLFTVSPSTDDIVIDNEKCVFVTPAKRDSRVQSSSAKKILKCQSSLNKAKRSYSQTAHHEALERISTATTTSNSIVLSQSSINNSCSFLPPSADLLSVATTALPISSPVQQPLSPLIPLSLSPPPPLLLPPNSKNKIKKATSKNLRTVTTPPPTQSSESTLQVSSCCIQKHWLGVYDLKVVPDRLSAIAPNIGREERIARHKALMRRQAFQLFGAQHLHRNPSGAQKRLVLISRLLQKYNNRDLEKYPTEKCVLLSCPNNALALTTHCYQHITSNAEQHLFLPCTAKFADNSQCRIPVFDITHELPLCQEHAWKRDNYNRIIQEQRPKKLMTMALLQHNQPIHNRQQIMLKEHTSVKTVTAHQRKRKSNAIGRSPQKRGRKPNIKFGAATHAMSSIKQRKSSTTSLESIASNPQTHSYIANNTASTVVLAPPSLAPLSEDGNGPIVGVNRMMNSHLKSNEMSQIVAQFTLASVDSDDLCGVFSQTTLPLSHTDSVLTQDMLSMCENSSAYASSEDTGVGGLSETELLTGNHDVEEIPLGDTRLLEEHDLTNVLNTLPVDAFNELFTAVRQDEREEVERALELADKQIKSLQQMTIGSDSDFLGDFLDVHDQILDDTDICSEIVSHSPDTSGIDTSTLFVDGGSNSTAGSCTGHTPTDIRGLVQT